MAHISNTKTSMRIPVLQNIFSTNYYHVTLMPHLRAIATIKKEFQILSCNSHERQSEMKYFAFSFNLLNWKFVRHSPIVGYLCYVYSSNYCLTPRCLGAFSCVCVVFPCSLPCSLSPLWSIVMYTGYETVPFIMNKL